MNQEPKYECVECGGARLTTVYENRGVPVYVNFLWNTREAALACPRGDIVLRLCRDCGLIFNAAFDASKIEYREGYENSLHFSKTFQAYAEQLADSLIDRFDLREKTVVEIGCGGGEFLNLLCDRGPNKGVGFDPSPRRDEREPVSARVEIVHDTFSAQHVDSEADFICSRHTLEHVARPADMLGPIRQSIGRRLDVPVFFEVPNAMYTLKNHFIWDIIYEHTTYFTRTALVNAFAQSGLRAVNVYESFSGQFLCIEAYASDGAVDRVPVDETLTGPVDAFITAHTGYYDLWKATLATLSEAKKRVVLWGAGSKGVMFVNSFDVGGLIEHVVDINPKKHGMFIAGSSQEIIPPSALASIRPDVIIVANPVYMAEVTRIARAQGVSAAFMPL